MNITNFEMCFQKKKTQEKTKENSKKDKEF